jgi:hypothetical protein
MPVGTSQNKIRVSIDDNQRYAPAESKMRYRFLRCWRRITTCMNINVSRVQHNDDSLSSEFPILDQMPADTAFLEFSQQLHQSL